MRNKGLKKILVLTLVLLMGLGCLAGCGGSNANSGDIPSSAAGTLFVKVNPEISVDYDDQGNTVAVTAKNSDAEAIIKDYTGYEGKPCREVVTELVALIGGAGYFVEEVDGISRQITIEVAQGSAMPYDTFVDDVVYDVRECVSENSWHSPVATMGESDYGKTDYVDTDYGPDNDGVTDYDNDSDYGPNNDGVTDYNDNNSDYGPNSDGVTDYNDNNSDYGPNSDGVTDYNDNNSDYGPNSDGVTDYSSDSTSDYNQSDYSSDNDDDDDNDSSSDYDPS